MILCSQGFGVGQIGDGSDSPASRAWIKFDGGTRSTESVTIRRDNDSIRFGGLNPTITAKTWWTIESDRPTETWDVAQVTFQYTEDDILGFEADHLTVYASDATPQSQWMELPTSVDTVRRRITVSVNRLSSFAIGSNSDLTGVFFNNGFEGF